MARRTRHQLGVRWGTILSAWGVILFVTPGMDWLRAKGPMNPGHEALQCGQCHQAAEGTTRQQLQAKVRYLLGVRETDADFGMKAVGNTACLGCHAREDDRHPVFRFCEPRFERARAAAHPEQCTSCHAEHRARRVTVAATVCQHCHEEMVLRQDPVEVPHEQMAAERRFDLCLRCHDFHGNHAWTAPALFKDAIAPEQVDAYLAGDGQPYGDHILGAFR